MNPQAVIEEVLEGHGSEHPSKLSIRILEAIADAAAEDPGEIPEDYKPGQVAFLTFTEDESGEINLGFASNRDRTVGDKPSPAEASALKARDIIAGEIERSKGPRILLPH